MPITVCPICKLKVCTDPKTLRMVPHNVNGHKNCEGSFLTAIEAKESGPKHTSPPIEDSRVKAALEMQASELKLLKSQVRTRISSQIMAAIVGAYYIADENEQSTPHHGEPDRWRYEAGAAVAAADALMKQLGI